MKSKILNFFVRISVISISILIIFIGFQYTSEDIHFFRDNEVVSYKAKVLTADYNTVTSNVNGIKSEIQTLNLKCRILDKDDENKTVIVRQNLYQDDPTYKFVKLPDKNDVILIASSNIKSNQWYFVDYYRIDTILILAFLFSVLLIVIGRWKGLNALISLVLTSAYIFAVFLPWILSGKSIGLGTIITAIFVIVMSLLILEGINIKGLVTIMSCGIGTTIASFIPLALNSVLHLSGFIDEHSIYLSIMNPEINIDLVGIVYAGIVIGSLGAIMDVAMDLSSSLYEIKRHTPDISFKALFSSGIKICQDIIGTMTNTLILAFMGSALAQILLLISYAPSLIDLLNKELIIVDLLQALSGSIAVVLTAPITAFIATFFLNIVVNKSRSKS